MQESSIFHDQLPIALEKDKWTITYDPLSLKIDDVELKIDWGGSTVLAAQKSGQKIPV